MQSYIYDLLSIELQEITKIGSKKSQFKYTS
jgi:hypothetical protein